MELRYKVGDVVLWSFPDSKGPVEETIVEVDTREAASFPYKTNVSWRRASAIIGLVPKHTFLIGQHFKVINESRSPELLGKTGEVTFLDETNGELTVNANLFDGKEQMGKYWFLEKDIERIHKFAIRDRVCHKDGQGKWIAGSQILERYLDFSYKLDDLKGSVFFEDGLKLDKTLLGKEELVEKEQPIISNSVMPLSWTCGTAVNSAYFVGVNSEKKVTELQYQVGDKFFTKPVEITIDYDYQDGCDTEPYTFHTGTDDIFLVNSMLLPEYWGNHFKKGDKVTTKSVECKILKVKGNGVVEEVVFANGITYDIPELFVPKKVEDLSKKTWSIRYQSGTGPSIPWSTAPDSDKDAVALALMTKNYEDLLEYNGTLKARLDCQVNLNDTIAKDKKVLEEEVNRLQVLCKAYDDVKTVSVQADDAGMLVNLQKAKDLFRQLRKKEPLSSVNELWKHFNQYLEIATKDSALIVKGNLEITNTNFENAKQVLQSVNGIVGPQLGDATTGSYKFPPKPKLFAEMLLNIATKQEPFHFDDTVKIIDESSFFFGAIGNIVERCDNCVVESVPCEQEYLVMFARDNERKVGKIMFRESQLTKQI